MAVEYSLKVGKYKEPELKSQGFSSISTHLWLQATCIISESKLKQIKTQNQLQIGSNRIKQEQTWNHLQSYKALMNASYFSKKVGIQILRKQDVILEISVIPQTQPFCFISLGKTGFEVLSFGNILLNNTTIL